jgi:hypothetical protein
MSNFLKSQPIFDGKLKKRLIFRHCDFSLPPATRGTLFEKTVPLDPLQKLFIITLYFLQTLHIIALYFLQVLYIITLYFLQGELENDLYKKEYR